MKRVNPEELEIGKVYWDADGCLGFRYKGRTYLYEFSILEYDEDADDFAPKGNATRLTESEVRRLFEA